MGSRKAMELSVNFIVTFILAVVIFSMGIVFARNIMSGGTELTKETYKQYQDQIGQLVCSRGESICISTSSKNIERTKIDFFPVNIRNDLKENLDFVVIVEKSKAYRKTDNSEIAPADWKMTWLYDEEPFSLDPGESRTIPVLVKPAKDCTSGKYSFNVMIYYINSTTHQNIPYPDDKLNKVYANVGY